jgi:hypothetical protein
MGKPGIEGDNLYLHGTFILKVAGFPITAQSPEGIDGYPGARDKKTARNPQGEERDVNSYPSDQGHPGRGQAEGASNHKATFPPAYKNTNCSWEQRLRSQGLTPLIFIKLEPYQLDPMPRAV